MRNIVLVGVAFFMTGCAQYTWMHTSKNEMQFNSDRAYCQNESISRIQDQVAQPVAPIYGQSSQYNTNCSAFGNTLNCTTSSTPNYLAQVQQQNAQNMAQAGANIGTAIARQRYFDNCMVTLGWSKSIINSGASENKINLNALGSVITRKNDVLEKMSFLYCKNPNVVKFPVEEKEEFNRNFYNVDCVDRKVRFVCDFSGDFAGMDPVPSAKKNGSAYVTPICWTL